MRLWLDEMIPDEVARQLRSAGCDVLGVQEHEQHWARGLDDIQQLEVATRERRVLVTYDVRHFASISRAWAHARRQHYGILLVKSRTVRQHDIGGLVRRLARFMQSHQADDETADQVLFLD